MKIKLFTLLVPILIAVVFVSCGKSGDTLVVIDDDKITSDEFTNYYYTQNKILMNLDMKEIDKLANDPNMENHPTVNKSKFMDFLVSRKLLMAKALSDPEVNKKELEAIIELTRMQGIATYYLTEKLKNDITVTDEEVNAFYNQNRNLFKGVPIDESIMGRIKQQIFMQKFERKSAEFVMNLVAESKVSRDGFKKFLKDDAAGKKTESAGAESLPAKAETPAKK